MKRDYTLTLGVLLLLFLSSCEKEISINLNKTNPRYVIEANISDILNDSRVKITKTLNFDEATAYPTVSNALVTIKEISTNKIDTLTELSAGIYSKPTLMGKINNSYLLTVKIGNEIFTSTSTMPAGLHLDSIIQQNLAGSAGDLGPPPGTPAAGKIIQILPVYTNPYLADIYYQYVITRNSKFLNNIIPRKELIENGPTLKFPLFIEAKKDDIITVDMQFIEKKIYDYLFGVSENFNQFSATPSNPDANFSNGALGYFKAHTSNKKTTLVK